MITDMEKIVAGYLSEYRIAYGLGCNSKLKQALCSTDKLIEMLGDELRYCIVSARWVDVNEIKRDHPDRHYEELGFE